VFALLLVNYIDYGSLTAKLIGNASAYAVGTTGHYDYFIFEHKYIILYIINIISPSAFVKVSESDKQRL
jgi:hypothetical protein